MFHLRLAILERTCRNWWSGFDLSPWTGLSHLQILTIRFGRDEKSGAGNFTAELLIQMHKVIKLNLEKASIILKGGCLILSSKSNWTWHQPDTCLLFCTGSSQSNSAKLLIRPVTYIKKQNNSNVSVCEGTKGDEKQKSLKIWRYRSFKYWFILPLLFQAGLSPPQSYVHSDWNM